MPKVLSVIAHAMQGAYPAKPIPCYIALVPNHALFKALPPTVVHTPCTARRLSDSLATLDALYRDAFGFTEGATTNPYQKLLAMLAADETKLKNLIPYIATLSTNHGALTTHPWFSSSGSRMTKNVMLAREHAVAMVFADAEAASSNPDLFHAQTAWEGEYDYRPLRTDRTKHNTLSVLHQRVHESIGNHNAALSGTAFTCEVNVLSDSLELEEPPTARTVFLDDVYPDPCSAHGEDSRYERAAQNIAQRAFKYQSKLEMAYTISALSVAIGAVCKRPTDSMYIVIP